jgi:hypothetical protein
VCRGLEGEGTTDKTTRQTFEERQKRGKITIVAAAAVVYHQLTEVWSVESLWLSRRHFRNSRVGGQRKSKMRRSLLRIS